MNKSESIKELATALSKAQGELENATKTVDNDYYGSKYADLAQIINISKKVLADNGLCVIQMPSLDGEFVTVETMLCHTSGEWIISTAAAPLDAKKHNAQGVGAAITYLRRYSLSAYLLIAQEDDDGNSVSINTNKPTHTQATQQAAQQPKKPVTRPSFEIGLAVDEIHAARDEEDLKSLFGGYWKRATEEQKPELQQAYDFVKKEMKKLAEM